MRDGWQKVALEMVCDVHDSQRKPINATERKKRISGKSKSELYPYYGATGQVGFIDDYVIDGEYVLLGEDGAPFFDSKKNVAYIINGKSWVNNHAHILSFHFNNKYLMFYLNQLNFEGYVSGTTRLKLNQTTMKKIPIPISPLPEQRASVGKIEHLFSELDNGIENLKAAKEQLKIYRQPVLKKAFEGELTRDWREKQTDLPSAEELLQKIEEERERYYQQKVDEWERNGKEGRKPSTPSILTNKSASIANSYLNTPTWIQIKLEEVGELYCGQSPSVSEVNYEGNGILYVTGPEQWNGNKIGETKWTENPERIVPDGAVFITVKGAGVGKLFPGIECAIGRDIYAFLPSRALNFKYVLYFLTHSIDLIIMQAQGDIPGLSKSHILNHNINLCSIDEQQRIVEEIETRLSVADKLAETINENIAKAESLRQSILKKAFNGELLNAAELEACRNEPDWEPAEKLLERIK